jgi:hypothetical protein
MPVVRAAIPGTRIADIRTIDAWAAEESAACVGVVSLERALEAMALLQTRQVIGKAVSTP